MGTISTLGVSQTLLATEQSAHLSANFASCLNTVISIVGGVLSTIIVAFLQHHWRMIEDERRFRRDHPKSKPLINCHKSYSKSD